VVQAGVTHSGCNLQIITYQSSLKVLHRLGPRLFDKVAGADVDDESIGVLHDTLDIHLPDATRVVPTLMSTDAVAVIMRQIIVIVTIVVTSNERITAACEHALLLTWAQEWSAQARSSAHCV
jgi:hypothetical protein